VAAACGTRGAARIALRGFVKSLEAHREAHPRVALFCALASLGGGGGGTMSGGGGRGGRKSRGSRDGMGGGGGGAGYNARLLPTYALPALRAALAPAPPRALAALLSGAGGGPVPADRGALVAAVAAAVAPAGLGAAYVDHRFGARLRAEARLVGPRGGGGGGSGAGLRGGGGGVGGMVDLDKALLIALDVWRLADALVAARHARAGRVITHTVRASLRYRHAGEPPAAATTAAGAQGAGLGGASAAPAAADAATPRAVAPSRSRLTTALELDKAFRRISSIAHSTGHTEPGTPIQRTCVPRNKAFHRFVEGNYFRIIVSTMHIIQIYIVMPLRSRARGSTAT
jgi:hypothetical protein